MKRVLLLNSDWSPLHFVTYARAITLVYTNKAETISSWIETICSPSIQMKIPATIRLINHVSQKWKMPKFKRRALFNRDNWQCQYCGIHLNVSTITIDHVVPKAMGGEKTWLNCVAACSRCNKKKANQTPEQAGMKLLKKPVVPKSYHFWSISLESDAFHPEWQSFF